MVLDHNCTATKLVASRHIPYETEVDPDGTAWKFVPERAALLVAPQAERYPVFE